MTREDIRKLIGGYATGTLTEAERKLLYEAALDDQELFDDLAREQTLKEVLDEPGAKSRLIAALAPRDAIPVWWKRPIAWATSGMAAVAVAALAFVSLRQSPPIQVAQTRTEAIATPTAAPPPPVESPLPASAPHPAIAKKADVVAQDAAGRSEKAAEPLEKKATETLDAPKNEKETDKRDAKIEALAVNGREMAAAPPPQAAQTEARRKVVENSSQSVSQAQTQSQVSGPSQQKQIVGGFISGQAGAAAPALRAARPSRFAFDYSVEANRRLVIRVASSGYLSVTGSKSVGVIFPVDNDGRVAAGSTTRITIPAEVPSVVIVFSAAARADSTTLADAISSAKDSPTGTVEDPNPSPNSKLVVELKIP